MDIEKMYTNIETHCNNKQHIRIIAGDFNAQVGLGIDPERDDVEEHATGQSNKRRILMIQNNGTLNTTFKNTRKQYTFGPKVEKKSSWIT